MLRKIAFIFALGLSASYGTANAMSPCEQICEENFQLCSSNGQDPDRCLAWLNACVQICP